MPNDSSALKKGLMVVGVIIAVAAFVVTFQGLASFVFALSMEVLMRAFFMMFSKEDGRGGVTLRVPKGSLRAGSTVKVIPSSISTR